MFVTKTCMLQKNWNQTIRSYGGKSLVLKKKIKKKNSRRISLETALRKKLSEKKIIKVIKEPSDYFEYIWLNNLNHQNLNIYRKTSFGSFRKINIKNFLKKLEEIKSKDVDNVPQSDSIKSLSMEKNNYNEKKLFNNDKNLASPQMSDFFIKNMLSFPLLKSNCKDSLDVVLDHEKEEFGLIDSAMFPSVTRILNETMSESAKTRLEEWKKNMIQKLGEEEFKKYSQDLLNQGSKLHHCLKVYFETGNKNVTDFPEIEGCWDSLATILPDITNVKMVEEAVHHPVLMYKGVVDCVASYRNVPCVIEWKKSEKCKAQLSGTYDAPLQLCAYLGALSWKKFDISLCRGLVVVAYTTGCPANVFSMDLECCQYYWMQWLRRLQLYWLSKSSIIVSKESDI